MQFAERFIVHITSHFREPIIPAGEDRRDGAERHHVMKMRHDVVGVGEHAVDARVGDHHPRHTAHGEQEYEFQRPEHGGAELNGTSPHGGKPREDLDAGRHRDHHRGEHKESLGVDPNAGHEHVVRPNDKPDKADSYHGVDHTQVAEDGFFRKGGTPPG